MVGSQQLLQENQQLVKVLLTKSILVLLLQQEILHQGNLPLKWVAVLLMIDMLKIMAKKQVLVFKDIQSHLKCSSQVNHLRTCIIKKNQEEIVISTTPTSTLTMPDSRKIVDIARKYLKIIFIKEVLQVQVNINRKINLKINKDFQVRFQLTLEAKMEEFNQYKRMLRTKNFSISMTINLSNSYWLEDSLSRSILNITMTLVAFNLTNARHLKSFIKQIHIRTNPKELLTLCWIWPKPYKISRKLIIL
jgi:hypothetical protein